MMISPAIFFIAACAIAVVALIWVVRIYNRLVTLRQRYRNAYAQIDVQLKRRHNLIPNLVETAKGYMAHERQTLEAVIEARNQAARASTAAAAAPGDAAAVTAVVAAETVLRGQLGRFIGLAEAYPDLKANQTMAQLMEELRSTENRIAFARQAYNDAVMQYNTAREVFPNTLLVTPFGFGEAPLFQLEDASQREVVKVELNT